MTAHGRLAAIGFEREFLSPRTAPRSDSKDMHVEGAAQRLPVRAALIVIVTLSAVLWFGIAELIAAFF
ncbi:MAG: hypothetical protein M0Z28_29660 [Rhodospirillales bacterium]|nr:hypothetical protein [Rhodospirillales bacterium]